MFLYPDITDLNNNEIDDFQELFLNLLLDIKDGLCNQNGTSWLILLNLKWNQEQLLLKAKLHLKVWVFLADKHKYINDFERLVSNESEAIYKKD